MEDNKINNNGIPYVDLDLPSGTLWATRNIGALRQCDSGFYFQWGDTTGHSKNEIGIGNNLKSFTLDDYKFNPSGDGRILPSYSSPNSKLDLQDDAARANMGGDWHIPSPEQIRELIDNTTCEWTTLDNVNGRLFTSKKDGTKSIFIPAAGYAYEGEIQFTGCSSFLWSSMSDKNNYIYHLHLLSDYSRMDLIYERYYGFPIRGVIDNKNNNSKNNIIMNENLNLVEKLKDVPKGTKLWSPIIGYCEFVEIDEDKAFPIICKPLENNDHWNFRSDGSFTTYDGTDCVLFPSKESRDWSSFKAPKKHKHFEPFQKVLAINLLSENKGIWQGTLYSYYVESSDEHVLIDGSCVTDEYIIPYDGNEDKLGKIVEVKG
jgi:hypothetical protein